MPKKPTEVELLRQEVADLRKALEGLTRAVGIEPAILPSQPTRILALIEQARADLLTPPEALGIVALQEWTQTLLRISPGYLRAVALYADLEQPWRPFLEIADHLIGDAHNDTIASTPLVFGILAQARRNVLHAAHVWAMEEGSPTDAPPVVGDILSERIRQSVALLYGRATPRERASRAFKKGQ